MADLASIKNNVRKILAAEFGTVSENEIGSFFIRNESTVAFIDIADWDHGGQNVGVIEIYAFVAMGLKEVNKDLAVELTTDLSRRFGSWFFMPNDAGGYNLLFKTDLIAATVDPAELINAVMLVAIVANEEDDKIVRKYGGSVFVTD
ncbi:hypothetical protein MCEMRE217_00488 [Candidatus Nanopelagicaceae bacterium]